MDILKGSSSISQSTQIKTELNNAQIKIPKNEEQSNQKGLVQANEIWIGNDQYSKLNKDNQTEDKILKLLNGMKSVLVKHPTELKFSIHERTKKVMVKIIDSEKQEVIKEIPSEKDLDAMAELWDLSGIFVDKRT
ncbi:MAG: hypothetical protein ACD_19C00051G0001 [uncultured bacterium]|nr:MAG: hypothetical protein ACD_19C00051G0001 [uncultured bacterium]